MPKQCELILYPEDEWTIETIIQRISMYTTIKQYAFILHDQDVDNDGNSIKPHFHIFLYFGTSNASLKAVARWFTTGENAVQKIMSNRYHVLRYYLHDGYPDKHPYSISDMVANFDVENTLKEADGPAQLKELIDGCATGRITRSNFAEFISPQVYALHEVKFNRAWNYYDQVQLTKLNGRTNCRVIWAWGESYTGKSTISHAYCEKQGLTVYQTARGNDPFSKYVGQDAVILDDIRPYEPFSFSELLNLLDPHFSNIVHSRYHDKFISAKLLFVTCILSPEQFYECYGLSKEESAVQLYRRIAEVWHFDRKNISFQKFDTEKKTFVDTGVEANPIERILQSIPKVEEVDSASIIRQL